MLCRGAMIFRRSSLVLVLVLNGCGGSSAPVDTQPAPAPTHVPDNPAPPPPSGPPTIGDYGYESPPNVYDGATASASSTAAAFHFQCRNGNTGPIVTDAAGHFSLKGTVDSVGGGPTPTISDVTFSGTITGDTMTLTVAWPITLTNANGEHPSTQTYGPVALTKGVVPTRQPGCI
jgi:hypothetical protein